MKSFEMFVRIVHPKFPWYIFPGMLTLELAKRYQKHFRDKYKLIPIPNQLYAFLLKHEFIKSEHKMFVSEEIFDRYAESHELNFVNMLVNGKKSIDVVTRQTDGDTYKLIGSEIVKQVLTSKPKTIVVQL